MEGSGKDDLITARIFIMIEKVKEYLDFLIWFLWEQIFISIILTLIIKNPCKSNKCLVRASCTLYCQSKLDYLKHCDQDGKIMFQRICAITIIFSTIVLSFGVFTIIVN